DLDIVRIFVEVPEQDANYVQVGTKASVLVRAYRDQPIPGKVTRTSWALNAKSRTLRAEVDLVNPQSRLLPGMYAYGTLTIERRGSGHCRWPRSCMSANRRSVGRMKRAAPGGLKSRRASATASGSRSPIAGSRRANRSPW